MKAQRITQHQKTKDYHEHCSKEIIVDDYNLQELEQIFDSFQRHFANTKHVTFDCFLRSNLNFLLGHFFLLREKSRWRAKLSNLQLLHLENESSTLISCLLYIISNDKINQNDQIEYQRLLRHRKIQLCIFSTITNYFV